MKSEKKLLEFIKSRKDAIKIKLKRSNNRILKTCYLANQIYKNNLYYDLFNDIDNTSGRVLYFRKYGALNPDKRIYITGFGDDNRTAGGLLAEIRRDLIEMLIVERFNLTPVIEFRNSLYAEKDYIHGTKNVFEFYFKQPSNVSVEDAWKSKYVCVQKNSDAIYGEISMEYDISDKQINKLGDLYRTYFKLNERTANSINDDINALLGINYDRILGIHIRGTDFNNNYSGHPVPVKCDQYFEAIERINYTRKYDYYFLATDDERLLSEFKKRYGDKLLYYHDVIRSKDNEGVHIKIFLSNKSGSGYRAGYEVIRDAYTLSGLRGLVAGHSGCQLMARIIKKSMSENYEDFIMISNGICDNVNSVVHLN